MAQGNRDFRLAVADEGGLTVITVEGEVDFPQAIQLRQALQAISTAVVVDLNPCSYMSAAGFVALLNGRLASQERQQRLVVVYAPGTQPHRLFGLVGASQFLPLYETREDALGAAVVKERRSGLDRRGQR